MTPETETPLPLPPGLTPEMVAQLPTPEEITKQAEAEAAAQRRLDEINAHNLGVQMARDQELEARRIRRIKAGKEKPGDREAFRNKPGLTKPKKKRASAARG